MHPKHKIVTQLEDVPALIHYDIKEHPGYYGAFTTQQTPGFLPNGTRIKKGSGEEGDLTPPGTLGTVLGSMSHPAIGGGYFVAWDNAPKRAVFVMNFKIERAEG